MSTRNKASFTENLRIGGKVRIADYNNIMKFKIYEY